MTVYDLYVESGPKRRKTMVHVLDLLGCIANGPTTDDALAATPEAIRAFRRLLQRHGDDVDPAAAFEIRITEHITEGGWLGNGSPYLVFGPDLEPLTAEEIETYLARFHWMREELAAWVATQGDKQLDVSPEGGGRTARKIILHVLGTPGGYLSSALGGAPGFGKITGAAERGELDLPTALRQVDDLAQERVRATTPEEWSAVRMLPAGPRTLRKGLRRMLEHDWEHLAELSRRPGGPKL